MGEIRFDNMVLELLDAFGKMPVADLVEYLWRKRDLELDDPPDDQVHETVVRLEKEGRLLWDKEEEVVWLNPEHEAKRQRSEAYALTLMKWRATIVGSYFLPDGTDVDIERVFQALDRRRVDVGNLSREFNSLMEIDLDWSFSGIRCESRWSRRSFYIHAYTFEEPMQEIIDLLEHMTTSRKQDALVVLPSAGAFLAFFLMRETLKQVHPQIRIRISEMDVRLTGGR